ncbi:DUF2510 domain-containing protein [Pseudactinotalea sp. Z1732]|uniref:DUF2510 domain-containing protein n=1 Tax=Micrococcales TaxID=85006 RepID=UPI003C7E8AAB
MSSNEPAAGAVEREPIPPGWYPDPLDAAGQRYFDGSSWTMHVAPRPAVQVPVQRRRYAHWVLTGGAVVLAVVIGLVALNRAMDRPEPVDFPTIGVGGAQEDDPTEAGQPEVVPGEQFTAGDAVAGSIAEGQEWHGTLTVAEEALILLDARPVDDGDLTMSAHTADGERVVGNDDRGELARIGGSDLDPVLVLSADPGSYQVVVGSWLAESASDFELVATIPEPVEVEGEIEESWDLGAGAMIMRTLVVSEPGPYLIEVMAEGGAHGFLIDTVSGEVTTWRSGAEHIQEERDLATGRHLLIISRDGLDAGDLALAIGPA